MKRLTIALVLAAAGMASTSAFAAVIPGGAGHSGEQVLRLDGGWTVRGDTSITAGAFVPNANLVANMESAQKVGGWLVTNDQTGSFKITSLSVNGPAGDTTSSFVTAVTNTDNTTLPTSGLNVNVHDTQTSGNLEVQLWKAENAILPNGEFHATVVMSSYSD